MTTEIAVFQAAAKVSDRIRSRIPGFVAKRRDEVDQIAGLLEERDFETIVHIGHKLNGSGTGYGFPELSVLGTGLEEAAEAQDAGAVGGWTGKLQVRLREIQASLP